jgi:hypothetical protein
MKTVDSHLATPPIKDPLRASRQLAKPPHRLALAPQPATSTAPGNGYPRTPPTAPINGADGGSLTDTQQLVDAKTLANWLGVNVSFVYAHAAELGALRLPAAKNAGSKTAKPRLRFDLEDVKRRISCYPGRESEPPDPAPQAALRPRRRRRAGTNVDLLPIRGSSFDG